LPFAIGKGEMRMKKFSVLVSTTYDGYVEVDASSHDEAIELARTMVWNQEINPVRDFDPFTEILFADEVENEKNS
jgi:hypothetical protein